MGAIHILWSTSLWLSTTLLLFGYVVVYARFLFLSLFPFFPNVHPVYADLRSMRNGDILEPGPGTSLRIRGPSPMGQEEV